MGLIEICLYLFPQGTQKWARVLMIHCQKRRALVFTLTGYALVQIQPVFVNEGFMLKNKRWSSLRSSVQRRRTVPLFHSSEQRLWLIEKYTSHHTLPWVNHPMPSSLHHSPSLTARTKGNRQ